VTVAIGLVGTSEMSVASLGVSPPPLLPLLQAETNVDSKISIRGSAMRFIDPISVAFISTCHQNSGWRSLLVVRKQLHDHLHPGD